MVTRTTGFWIREQNGAVTECWDVRPNDTKMATEPGWREAVEVKPDVTPNREYITTHSFDLSTTPAEIVWAKTSLTVEDRRGGMLGNAKSKLQQVVQEQLLLEMSSDPAEEFDPAAVTAVKAEIATRVAAINAAVTHEDLDALMV
jgi:hypothetical protein